MNVDRLESFDPRMCISGKITRINRMIGNIFRKYLNPFGITNSQTSILFILSKKEGLTQKNLAKIAVLEKSTLNRNLKRLFENGYLTRDDFPIIRITTKGKELVNAIIPEWEKAMKEVKELLREDGEEALDLLHLNLLKR